MYFIEGILMACNKSIIMVVVNWRHNNGVFEGDLVFAAV